MPPDHAPPALLAAIESLETTLQLTEALAASGRRVDLGGLDAEITALCAAVLGLPAPQRPEAGLGLRRLERRVARLQALG